MRTIDKQQSLLTFAKFTIQLVAVGSVADWVGPSRARCSMALSGPVAAPPPPIPPPHGPAPPGSSPSITPPSVLPTFVNGLLSGAEVSRGRRLVVFSWRFPGVFLVFSWCFPGVFLPGKHKENIRKTCFPGRKTTRKTCFPGRKTSRKTCFPEGKHVFL